MDDEMNVSLGAELELERRLDRYAQVRLSPSPASVARMRARVMREARLGFAEAAQARSLALAHGATSARGLGGERRVLRRVGGLLAAACLTLGVAAGTMAASQAGGPLYGPRIGLEGLMLPSDPAARAAAEIGRLEARVAEFIAAAGHGDQPAVAAALDAYQAIAEEALSGAGANAAVLATLQIALDRHIEILQAVVGQVPEQARPAIERNIERASDRNQVVLDRIDAATPGPPPRPGVPGGTPVDQKTPKPDRTPTPDPTAKPGKTPKPTPEPVVIPTDDPGPPATPTARPTPPAGPPSERPDRTPPARGNDVGTRAP
jgi:hypothetical protein